MGNMKQVFLQPRMEVVDIMRRQIISTSGEETRGISAEIDGYDANTGSGFSQE